MKAIVILPGENPTIKEVREDLADVFGTLYAVKKTSRPAHGFGNKRRRMEHFAAAEWVFAYRRGQVVVHYGPGGNLPGECSREIHGCAAVRFGTDSGLLDTLAAETGREGA